MNESEELTAAELARLLGVTKRSVSDAAMRGIVVRGSKDGTYMLGPSVRGYVANLQKVAAGRGGNRTAVKTATQRAALTKAQAELTSAKAARMRGDVVPLVDVERSWTAIARLVRSRLLAVGQRHPAADPDIRVALTELAQDDAGSNPA